MVRRSHRDGLGSASQAPRDRASGTNGATDVPVVGQRCGTQGPGPGPVKAWPVMVGGGVWVCSVTLTWFLLVWEETQEPGLRVTTCSGGLSATAFTRFHRWAGGVLLGNPPPAWRERRKEVIPWCTVHHSPPLETQRLRKLLFYWSFGYRWLLGQRRNKNKMKQRILHPALLRGREWCGHHLPTSSSLHLWVTRLRASCTCACRRVWRGPGRAGRPVCDRLHDAARWKAAAAAWERGRPQGGAHGDEQAEGLQPEWKQQRVSSGAWVCFCAAENCWAQLSTASPKRPVCDTGAFRNCTFSCSFMSVRHSQRWRSWTTSVDIARPRDCAVTFVARSARSVAARSSCRTARSCPPSCRFLSALAWWTCSNAMACRAEAASPQAL